MSPRSLCSPVIAEADLDPVKEEMKRESRRTTVTDRECRARGIWIRNATEAVSVASITEDANMGRRDLKLRAQFLGVQAVRDLRPRRFHDILGVLDPDAIRDSL